MRHNAFLLEIISNIYQIARCSKFRICSSNHQFHLCISFKSESRCYRPYQNQFRWVGSKYNSFHPIPYFFNIYQSSIYPNYRRPTIDIFSRISTILLFDQLILIPHEPCIRESINLPIIKCFSIHPNYSNVNCRIYQVVRISTFILFKLFNIIRMQSQPI